jgi:hypothetical protein
MFDHGVRSLIVDEFGRSHISSGLRGWAKSSRYSGVDTVAEACEQKSSEICPRWSEKQSSDFHFGIAETTPARSFHDVGFWGCDGPWCQLVPTGAQCRVRTEGCASLPTARHLVVIALGLNRITFCVRLRVVATLLRYLHPISRFFLSRGRIRRIRGNRV